jgi:hypothetical protein
LGAGELGSYSRHPTTSNIVSSENLNLKIIINLEDFSSKHAKVLLA